LGNAALQINLVVNMNLASGITDAAGRVIDGPVSWLGYAFRFMQLPVGLFGVAVASVTLPAISRSAGLQQMDEFRNTLARSLGAILLLTIPSSVGLAVMGESMIAAVYQGGRFTAYDTHQTALALTCFSAGLAGYSALKTLAPAFYALDDARTPMLVSLASIAVNFVAAYGCVKWAGLGHAGLALATGPAPPQAPGHASAETGRQRRENRGCRGVDGGGLQAIERRRARRPGRRKACRVGRCGDFHPLGGGSILQRGAFLGHRRTGGGGICVLHCF
jgi:hypothetical protein